MSQLGRVFLVCLLLLTSALTCVPSSLSEEEDHTVVRTFPVTMHEDFSVHVLGAYAVTEVKRVLKNPWDEPMAHTFEFRVPSGALISNFSIEVNGTTYYADVMEKEEAEEEYQEAVSSGRTASLVASVGDETFEYKVSFAPRERMVAILRYEQVLLKQSGWHEYQLPFDEASYADNVQDFSISIDIQAAQTILELDSSGYEDVSEGIFAGCEARWWVRMEDLKPNENATVRWRTGAAPPSGIIYYGEWDGTGYFLHVFDPDPTIFGEEQVGKDFVFILDKSGSMRGQKFEKSKEALEHIYGTLDEEDRFSLVLFNGNAWQYSDSLVPVDESTVGCVLDYIRALEPGGSTNIHSGVVSALGLLGEDGSSVPVIVLLTDGRANTGIYHSSEFRRAVQYANTVDASIFSIAVGGDADWTLVEALSLENHGRAIWVTESDDMVPSITKFVEGFSHPLVSDLRFDYGPGANQVHPESVRAHYRGSEVLVAGRLEHGLEDIPLMLNATGAAGDTNIEQTFPIEVLPVHDYVPRFWAFSRIKHLLDEMKYAGPDDTSVEEITDLAIEFHFVTDYTSLFVELPEDLQDRFDNSTAQYPGEVASSADFPVTLHAQTMYFCGSTPERPDSSSGNPSPTPPASTTTTKDSDADGWSDGSQNDAAAATARSSDLDLDGLPDIEESYRSSVDQGDLIILPEAPKKGVGGAMDDGAEARDSGELPLGVMVVPMLIILIPLSTIIIVAVHYHLVGRERLRGR